MKVLAILCVAACSLNADYTGTVYQCGVHGECPADYACVGGFCLPESAAGTTCAIDVATGKDHTCAVRDDGTVWCWGRNDRGQLGDQSTMDAVAPVKVVGLAVAATAVFAGATHTCALGGDGSVWCWGENAHGQLGDGTVADSRTPIQAKTPAGVTSLALGDHHSCALAGDVFCWGGDEDHQLGDAGMADRPMPAIVNGLSGVMAVAAGGNTTCAIGGDKLLYCWGDNGVGQLGDATTTTRGAPAAVPLIGGVSAVAVGPTNVTAVTVNGVFGWGLNDNGGVGDGTEVDTSSPVHSPIAAALQTVSANYQHACGVDADHRGWCWGYDGDGELFDGREGSRYAPQLTPLTDLAKLAMGEDHACALTTDHAIACVGWNGFGQLGDGLRTSRPSPQAVMNASATQIFAGGTTTCALHADLSASCWGRGDSGQLGDGTTTNRGTLAPVAIGNLSKIAIGPDESCALDANGGVACWGDNTNGKLGDGDTYGSTVPVHVAVTGAVDIAVGGSHACAALGSGGATCWGENYNGQLGIGHDGDTRSTPTAVVMVTDAVQIIAGNIAGCVRTGAGAVMCWGTGSMVGGVDTDTPTTIPTLASGVTAIAGHSNFACAIKSDHSLVCWGANDSGQLGIGTTAGHQAPQPVTTGVAQIAAGGSHACAIKDDGTVWCWGRNNEGQVGTGDHQDAHLPTQIPLDGPALAIAAGDAQTCALTASGLSCWGGDIFGELGDGVVDWLVPRGVNLPCN